jgi:hypothetical protein
MASTNKGRDEWEEEFQKWRAKRRKNLEKSLAKQAQEDSPVDFSSKTKKTDNTTHQTTHTHSSHNKHQTPDHPSTSHSNVPSSTNNDSLHQAEGHPLLTKFLIFLAFAIPALILIYALYINFLPFGWDQSYELTIDQEGIISPVSSEIYLTNAQGRQLLSLPDGVDGQVNVVIEPPVVIKNATVTVEIDGDDGVYLATPLETDLSTLPWDFKWDFTTGVPSDLEGTAEFNESEGCVYFDAVQEQTLFLPDSEDDFEDGPMSIYVKWKPSETSRVLGNYQQLVGHFNWEIWQGDDSIRFQVGRMNNAQGPFYSISTSIDETFFSNEHELLAIYSPDSEEGKGYIELWLDGKFIQRESIESYEIYEDYNFEKNLSIGRTPHGDGRNPFFDGCIYSIGISEEPFHKGELFDILQVGSAPISVPIIGDGNLNYIRLDISQ